MRTVVERVAKARELVGTPSPGGQTPAPIWVTDERAEPWSLPFPVAPHPLFPCGRLLRGPGDPGSAPPASGFLRGEGPRL